MKNKLKIKLLDEKLLDNKRFEIIDENNKQYVRYFEIIDENGRQYVRYNVDLNFRVQDDNKTLKIFVKEHKENNN